MEQELPVTWRRKLFPYLIFSLCLGLYLCPFLRIFWCSGDEGSIVSGAIRVTEGQVPLRDFFEVMGPGSFYWLAFFFKLFGAGVVATRISVALTSLSTALLMYFLARRLETGYDSVPAFLLLATTFGGLWPAVSHHNDSNLFALLSFTAVIGWIEKRRAWMLGLAGALAGMTTLFLQPKGILLFLSFVLIVFLFPGQLSLRSPFSWLTGGYLALGLVVVFCYWRAGGLSDLLYANVVWPITNYASINAVPYGSGIQKEHWDPWIAVFTTASPSAVAFVIASLLMIPFLFVFTLPLIGVLLAVFSRRLAFHSAPLPYWIAGAALWLSEFHRRDITHLAFGSPLLFIACLHSLAALAKKRSLVNTSGKSPEAASSVAGQLFNRALHSMHAYAVQLICISTFALALFNGGIVLAANKKIATRRGTFYSLHDNPVLQFVNSHIQPGEEIFAYPYCPQYYYLSATRNPTRFSILMYHINTASQFHEAVTSIEQRKVRYVIWQREFIEMAKCCWPTYSLPRKEDLIIEPYLTARYHLLQHIDGVDILERNNDFTLRIGSTKKDSGSSRILNKMQLIANSDLTGRTRSKLP